MNHNLINKILVATDGSEYSTKAVEYAVEIASISGSKIFALYVLDTGAFASIPMDMAWENIFELLKVEGEKSTGYVEDKCREKEIEVECFIRDGHPANEIIKLTKEISADLIIMGTLGKTGLEKFLLGSVAEKVLRNANVPVMIIKTKNSE